MFGIGATELMILVGIIIVIFAMVKIPLAIGKRRNIENYKLLKLITLLSVIISPLFFVALAYALLGKTKSTETNTGMSNSSN